MRSSKRLRLLVVMLCGLATTSCATTTATVETEPEGADPSLVCLVWVPISWSTRDTDQTIREAKANNAAREAWCGGRE